MRTLGAVLLLILCGAIAAPSSADSARTAHLRLVDRDPLTVHGLGFRARERVRVVASGSTSGRTVVRATSTGSFRVVFSAIAVDRCSSVRVVASGQGSEAVLKVLPSPMCAPARSP